jgi:secreted PhoX family phosphatase
MNKPKDFPITNIDADDIGYNNSSNESFNSVLEARLSRRNLLRGGVVSAAGALFGSLGLSACGGGGGGSGGKDDQAAGATETLLGFDAVAKSLEDRVIVPAGYTASVIYALGDPLTGSTSAFKNDGSDTDFENRAGDHHDGMEWFGLSGNGTPSTSSADRGVLGINHEATTDEQGKFSSSFIHVNGGTTTLPRPAGEVDMEVALHGVAIVEVNKTNGNWQYVKNSSFNRRITPLTAVELSGPARGDALMITAYSNTGNIARGTLNNCGTGKTPWGTLLTGEENFAGYFARGSGDDATRNDKSVTSLKRYGRAQGAASRHGWETGGGTDQYARWNISAGAGAASDYRNEMNTFGYIVEIDPYDKNKAVKKRTALGRFAHESAAFGRLIAGQPLAVYMGDDSNGEYMYKFVSAQNWNAADANPSDRVATGDKYLDSGKLYVAKFSANGTGQWIELNVATVTSPYTHPAHGIYTFANQADVLVNARLAADALGATKMDRPEWCSVNPANGEIYYTLTNNSSRTVPTGANPVDAANPRTYTDMKGSATQNGNVNGHIIRIKEDNAGSAATAFTWDVYLFGAESGADKSTVNLSNLTSDQDFSSPDGLAFTPSTGICWIQTDDSRYTDVTNCMMLAALPGQVGDGTTATLSYAGVSVTTRVGAKPTANNLKRFLVGPKGSEITGIAETPDGKALFVNIQHPGEATKQADIGDPTKYESHWPANAGYGAGGANTARPRSATIVITKDDGGRIGT